ncbi:type 1 glutamine amidotransferase domain-containing protein [Thermovenabulum gondwanense]|uniref:Putative cysteine protease YraA n=1 Tax=Thermovenabulum gondwanense TaxID=520767 RepID=A0A162MD26_9FIRM|nr:type 1 glutamine amidotransferase domain-containing protein [Thermovenabulum gondwanense]KYO65353.1 putative cysteine protease YraA [Thermovenabulum gondwanense]
MELKGKKIIMLAEEGFEDLELWYPVIRLREEGCEVTIVGTGSSKTYRGKYGLSVEVNQEVEGILVKDYDALLVPGGWAPDKLRRYKKVLDMVKEFYDEGKLLATICHGPWVFISAKVVKGHKMTCVNAIIDDVVNAGAIYEDKEVVVDKNIITSRTPKDLPAYMRAIIGYLKK